MFGFSGEHLIILFVILLVFGPKRLPQLGSTLGKTIRNFKDHFKGIQEPEYKRLGDKDDGNGNGA